MINYPNWLGLDIGGANIKYASLDGRSGSIEFPMWQRPDQLAETLANGIPDADRIRNVAVTMTGELADCFSTKQDGVAHICNAAESVFLPAIVRFYQTDGDFVDAIVAKRDWQKTAASNWHALASLVGQNVVDCNLIDIGSTTTDIIPVRNGRPATNGKTDLGRLRHGELIYTGVVRSPICALIGSVELDGIRMPIAQELFATMLDVYLVLGRTSESEDCRHTADGRPASREHAYNRLARMLCCDRTEIRNDMLEQLAHQAADSQAKLLSQAVQRKAAATKGESLPWVCVGEGAFLAREILQSVGIDPANDFTSAEFQPQSEDQDFCLAETAFAVAWLSRAANQDQ